MALDNTGTEIPQTPVQPSTPEVVNPDGNPVDIQSKVDIAPVNAPAIDTTIPDVNTTPPQNTTQINSTTKEGAIGSTLAADANIASTAISEGASQQNLYEDLSSIDKTQVETRIDNAVANQKEYQAIGEAQMVQKTANEEEYQQKLKDNQEAEIAALRLQQVSENIANQAAASDLKIKQENAERELQISNDIALQKSSIAFAKLGLSFSGAAINQASQIFTTGMYNLSSLKSGNAKNYADLQVKINSVQFDHIQQIGVLVQDTAEKEFASKERLRQFIGDTQNNILKDKKEAQDAIQKAIDTYKTERQAREDKLYSDMNSANTRLQSATKDIQTTLDTNANLAKSKIDMLISTGKWASLSTEQKVQYEKDAGIPAGTTAPQVTAKVTQGINDRLKAIVGSTVAIPKLILDKMQSEIQGYMALGYPMATAIQMTVDTHKNAIPQVKQKQAAEAAKAVQAEALAASKVELNKASSMAKETTATAAMIKAQKAGTGGGGSGGSSGGINGKRYPLLTEYGDPLQDIGGLPYTADGKQYTGLMTPPKSGSTDVWGVYTAPTYTPKPKVAPQMTQAQFSQGLGTLMSGLGNAAQFAFGK